MKPVRMWVGVVLITLGVIAILDAIGTLDWDRTVGEWWPVAIIGWGLAETIQDRTFQTRNTAMDALVALIGDIKTAREAGAPDEQLQAARRAQRRAQFMVDFVEAENSTGFHAGQEAVRILGQAIDTARQGQLSLRQPKTYYARRAGGAYGAEGAGGAGAGGAGAGGAGAEGAGGAGAEGAPATGHWSLATAPSWRNAHPSAPTIHTLSSTRA